MLRVVAVCLVAAIAVGCSGGSSRTSPREKQKDPDRVAAFRGLGTWVDVYDYLPAFQKPGQVPAVTADSVSDMARLGVDTLYLQAAQDDPRSEGDIASRRLVGTLLVAAHNEGMRVVAWYLPHYADVQADLRRIEALRDFRSHGQRFDAVALDIEWTDDVRDVALRNQRLIELSRAARSALGTEALGAIVLPPVLLEQVNPKLWPSFPWREIAGSYDVWLPMSYWTLRSSTSPYRDAQRYTTDNITGVRADVGRNVVVHPIGGIADASTAHDDEGFVAAARAAGAIGWSMYDFDTTSSDAWPRLRPGG
jgi:uncharacterized lipoprotein YddW (UPF0748 family)